uniref:DEAD/DEAH box helicase family protein n=1 Tax=Thiolapillus sp. TaxID=2017437 RepID=UPI003AF41EE9
FSKIKPKKRGDLPVDPVELFQNLKVYDSGINDLWLAQGDALRKWHENRAKPDVGIVLNTGAGKTLVGLLMAQSLVNETREKVLYACSLIQLVEQTREKASGYGLDVTTYFRSDFSNDLFTRGEAPYNHLPSTVQR